MGLEDKRDQRIEGIREKKGPGNIRDHAEERWD